MDKHYDNRLYLNTSINPITVDAIFFDPFIRDIRYFLYLGGWWWYVENSKVELSDILFASGVFVCERESSDLRTLLYQSWLVIIISISSK